MIIEEDLVTFEVAKLAKEKGFNESCAFYYITRVGNNNSYFKKHDGELSRFEVHDGEGKIEYAYTFRRNSKTQPQITVAPTVYQIQKWLRDKGYHIIIEPIFKEVGFPNKKYVIDHYVWRAKDYPISKIGGIADTYEEALSDAEYQILLLLEVFKENKNK